MFHEDDLPFVGDEAVEWVSPRYLKFSGQRLPIDITSMKMCFPQTADVVGIDPFSCKFSPDFRWVMYQHDNVDAEGLFLAPVELPEDE